MDYERRWTTHVCAPRDDRYLNPPTLISVTVRDGEDIQWIWTYLADGRRMVTGYRIIPQRMLCDLVR